ncbi:MAG: IS1380 family transposase [Anaerolineales bacterium]|nr:IS1380 family transposase [Anaerolineales bacterium]
MQSSSHDPARFEVLFDDDHAVANAGLVLVATCAKALGIEAAANELVDLGERAGAFRPGRKILTLLHAMVAGGDCIDDVDVLRSGSTGQVLGHRVMAPSTVGTFLRSFTFGHVRQLDRLFETILQRAWSAGAGPGSQPMTIDLDSTICEVHGHDKQGAAYGYTKQLGYHPLLATRATTGEILGVRQRKGSANTGRGTQRFIGELVARIRRAGASGPLTLRADSGFFSWKVIDTLKAKNVRFSITVPKNPAVTRAIEGIDEETWIRIDYPEDGEADVSETVYGENNDRLVVRRTRLTGHQAQLFPDWRYHALITNRDGHPGMLDADHRRHAVVELAIRDWKEGSGANHSPSGVFAANAAWLVLTALAHNLIRWVAALGVGIDGPIVAKTLRRHLITLPGRITHRSRRRILHLPTDWPWKHQFLTAVIRLQALPKLC